MGTEKALEWIPLNYLDISNTSSRMAVLILNRPIFAPCRFILELWQQAAIRVTVDGGTDRWLSFLNQNNIDIGQVKHPDFISGDMDSVLPETLKLFQEIGSQIIHTPDQDETDFTKALKEVKKVSEEKSLKIDSVVALVESSGRMDHIMGNINTLFKASTILPNIPVMLMCSASISWLLTKGRHYIKVPIPIWKRKSWCSLVPIGARCDNVSTEGLKWNLENSVLEFGGMVSTSNTYGDVEAVVKVETSCPILWSMGTKPMMNEL